MDRWALGILESLRRSCGRLAKGHNPVPEKVLPSEALAELAFRKPRPHANIACSSPLQSRMRRKDVYT